MSVITLTTNNSTRGNVSGGGTYTDGTSITVTANPNSGYLFACWSDGNRVVSSDATYTFTVNGNVTLKAYFYNDIDGVKVYGLCQANCRHQVMNIGQVVSLIQQMAENGWQVPDNYIPNTCVNELVEQNKGEAVKLFIGTQKEWTAWTGNKKNVLFIPTDETFRDLIVEKVDELDQTLTKLQDDLADGTVVVKNSHEVNGLEIKEYTNGPLGYGGTNDVYPEYIISRKKLIYESLPNLSIPFANMESGIYEFECTKDSKVLFFRIRYATDGSYTALNTCSYGYMADNAITEYYFCPEFSDNTMYMYGMSVQLEAEAENLIQQCTYQCNRAYKIIG